MSLDAFIAVNRCPLIKGAARLAAFQLADAHNAERGDCWIGYRLMAARAGASQKTMESGVRQLEELGFLDVERRIGRSNYYRLNIDRIRCHAIDSLKDHIPPRTASPRNGISAANSSDQPTEVDFGRGQKTASVKSSNNHSEKGEASISDPNMLQEGRLRKEWARDLRYLRKKLDEGIKRPFWHPNWGPPPNAPGCRVPADLLRRFGFAGGLMPVHDNESVRRR